PPAADEAALRDLCGKWVEIRIPRKVIDDEVRTVRSLELQDPKPELAAAEPQTAEPSLLNRSWPEGLPRAAPLSALLEQPTAEAPVPGEATATAVELHQRTVEGRGTPAAPEVQDGSE